jgi:two-component system, response regulator YesN
MLMRLVARSVRTRLLLTYLLLFTLPLLVVGLVSYRRLTREVAQTAVGAYQSTATKVTRSIDEQLRGLSSFTQQLAQLSWMQKLMYMQERIIGSDRVDPYALEEYQQQFRVYCSANPFVDDVAVFFTGKDFYISSRGKGDLRWLTEFPFKVEGMDLAAWTALLTQDNQQRVLPSINLDTYGVKRRGLLYLQSLHSPRYPDRLVRATFIAFIRREQIEEHLQVLHSDPGISAWITDADGALLAGDPGAGAPAAAASKGNPGASPRASALPVTDSARRRFYLFHTVSEMNRWHYYALVPREAILRHVDQAGAIVVVLMVACGVVGWFLSFGLAAMNYRPVSELMQLLQSQSPAARRKDSGNEYDWIQQSVKELMSQELALKRDLERDRPAATSQYLGMLLSGSVLPDVGYLKTLELLGVMFPHGSFCCAVVHPAPGADELRERMSQAVGADAALQYVDMGSHRAVVLNLEAGADLDRLADRIDQTWAHNGATQAAIGVGSIGAGIGHLSRSYREAAYAVDYRLVWGSRIVVLYDAVRDADQCYYYPIGTENIMTNLLRAGERDRATTLLGEVMSRNTEQQRSPPAAIRNLALNLALTAAKAAREAGVGAELHLDTRRVQELDSIDEIHDYLRQIIDEVCSLASRGRPPSQRLDRAALSAFVDKNLTNPALSLKMLADWCVISPSYASRSFLELFGCHFLDYVNAQRIEKAKVLLAEGTLTVAEVASSVGYTSDVTLRRLFKSREGFPPHLFQKLQKMPKPGSGSN